jgi:hypothetical protein
MPNNVHILANIADIFRPFRLIIVIIQNVSVINIAVYFMFSAKEGFISRAIVPAIKVNILGNQIRVLIH